MPDVLSTPDNVYVFHVNGELVVANDVVESARPRVSVVPTAATVEGSAVSVGVLLEFQYTENVSVSFATSNASALSGVDYTTTSGTVTIPAGFTTNTVTVTTATRAGTQGSRTFNVGLVSATDGTNALTLGPDTTAVVTISDAPETVTLQVQSLGSVDEGTTLMFRVSSSLPVPAQVTFAYVTSNGTGQAGTDYTSVSDAGAVIPIGGTFVDIPVSTMFRSGYQGSRTVHMTISNGVMDSAPVPITSATATGIIRDTESSGGNAYFDDLVALGAPTVHLSWSLRNQNALNLLLTTSNRPSDYLTYDPDSDPAPTKQDAARLYLPANLGQLPNGKGPKLPWSPQITSGKVLFVYDVYIDETWFWGMDAAPDMRGNKSFRIHKQGGTGGGGWSHHWNYPKTSNGNGIESVTTHDEIGLYGGYAEGVISQESFIPAGPGTPDQSGNTTRHQLIPNVWHRIWFEMRYLQDPSAFTEWNAYRNVTVTANPRETGGRWHMLSKWIMKEGDAAPTRLIYKVPVQPVSVTDFSKPPFYFVDAQIQFDTSQNGTGALEKWCYFRNVVLLRDYNLPEVPETDTFIFRSPINSPA